MIVAYVAPGCPHCARLLADLGRRRVACRVVDLALEPGRLPEVEQVSWQRRLPVVLDHERCTVGFAGGSSSFAELGLDR